MLKLSRTGLTVLKRRYKSVLLKCMAINMAAFMAAGVANAAYDSTAYTGEFATATTTSVQITYTTGTEGKDLSDRITTLENAAYITKDVSNLTNYTTTADLANNYATKTALTDGLATKQDTLTTNQINAVDSGITNTLVAQISTNKSAITTLNGSDSTTGSVANTVKTAAQSAEFTATAESGLTSSTTIKDAINEAGTGVQTNKTAIATLNSDGNTSGSVANTVKTSAQNATFTATGNISATTIGGALAELDTDKAGLATDNTFSGTNTFTKTANFSDGINVNNGKVTVDKDGNINVNSGAFTVSADGNVGTNNINTKGYINVNSGAFKVGSDGNVNVNNGKFTVDTDGSIKVNTNKFTVDTNGNTTVAGTMGVTGNTTLTTVTATGLASLDGGIDVNDKLTVGTDGSIKVNSDKFTVDTNGNTKVAGTMDVTGNTTLANTSVNGTLGVTGNTTLATVTATGLASLDGGINVNSGNFTVDTNGNTKVSSLTFNGTDTANAITSAVVTGTGDAATLVTTKTLMSSAENGAYTGSTKAAGGATPATIADTLNTIGDVSALTSSANFTNGGASTVTTISDALRGIDNTLGKIHALVNADGEVQSTTVASTTGTGSNLARGTTVEDHLVSLDNAIGNRTSMNTSMAVNYTDAGIANQDLSTAVSQVASNIGGAVTTTHNNVAATNTVNKNIDAINTAVGDVVPTMATTHYASGATNLSDAVKMVDNKLYSLSNEVQDLKNNFRAGMAEMAALSALVPNARANGNTQLSFGTGAYEGHTAAALGGFHWINDNVLLNIGASWGDSANIAYRAGITYSW
jgi:trimeric autotransporter adhesin